MFSSRARLLDCNTRFESPPRQVLMVSSRSLNHSPLIAGTTVGAVPRVLTPCHTDLVLKPPKFPSGSPKPDRTSSQLHTLSFPCRIHESTSPFSKYAIVCPRSVVVALETGPAPCRHQFFHYHQGCALVERTFPSISYCPRTEPVAHRPILGAPIYPLCPLSSSLH